LTNYLLNIAFTIPPYTDVAFQNANACHDFTDRVKDAWFEWEEKQTEEFRTGRKLFFTIQLTDYRRYDFANHHGTIRINIKDSYNSKAHIDNGWFGSTILHSLWRPGNRLFGENNIPLNYYLYGIEEEEK
jgi:adenine specific DNA methylase Mod